MRLYFISAPSFYLIRLCNPFSKILIFIHFLGEYLGIYKIQFQFFDKSDFSELCLFCLYVTKLSKLLVILLLLLLLTDMLIIFFFKCYTFTIV